MRPIEVNTTTSPSALTAGLNSQMFPLNASTG